MSQRTGITEELAYSVAAFEHAIEEFRTPPPLITLRRLYRRAARGVEMVLARFMGRRRRSFGQI
jgi:hypothetical protein